MIKERRTLRRKRIVPLNAHRLRDLRKARDLTQTELGERIGVSLKQVWRWEKGEGDPTGENLRLIARELAVTIDYLVDLTDDPHHYLSSSDLSPEEGELITKFRSDHPETALEIVADKIAEHISKRPRISGHHPETKG